MLNKSDTLISIIIKTCLIIVAGTFLLAILEGVHSIFTLPTLGILSGPFTFLWWPYFRNEISLRSLFGTIPILMIGVGLYSKKRFRFLAYLGGLFWVLVGFLYVISHID